MVNAKKTESKSNNKKEVKKDDSYVFEKEIEKLPPEFRDKIKKQERNFKEVIEAIESKAKKHSIGFYVNIEMQVGQNQQPVPNFDKLTLNFLLDDYEKPIPQFNAKLLLGEDFDKVLSEEIKKDENGQEYAEYTLKSNKNIKFVGNSISALRENCFDAIYDDLQKLGSSFVVKDNRGFVSALKSIDIHRNMLLQKFEKYVVVYAGAGSWLRGEKSNDFDIFVVVDDTDVKRMPRAQVKEQLTRIVWQMAQEVAQLTGIQLHSQIYLLTDFWDALKDAHPVMFTFLRDGVPFYDRGIYSAWKELLKLGKIRPSAEAIDMHMNVGGQLIDRAKKMFNEILMNDIYYSVLNPSQAILMLKGYNPTTPKETVKMFKEVLLTKEKCITQKEFETLESIINLFKKVEHNREYEVKGRELDTLIKNAEDFLKKIKKMFEEISEEKTKESILTTYSELLNQIRALPGFAEAKEKEILDKFDKEIVSPGHVPAFVKGAIKSLTKAKADFEKGNLTVTEVNKVLKEARNVLSEIKEYKSKTLANDFGRKRLLFTYSENKMAELINYDGKIYLMDLATNKSYEMKDKSADEVKTEELNFSDNSKYQQIKLDENLLGHVKKVLNSEEILL